MASLTVGIEAQGIGARMMGELAAAADDAGLAGVWAPELYDRSATIASAEMINRTARIEVGTAIAYGVGRSPLTLAAEARDLDELSGGRFVLGLGNGTRRMRYEGRLDHAILYVPAFRLDPERVRESALGLIRACGVKQSTLLGSATP